MFRRKPLGSRARRPFNKTNFRLRQAHQWMEAGEYLRAAALFDEMANGALHLQIPRAPFLFIQAGRGYLLGGDHTRGFDLIKQGLHLLADSGRWMELQRVSRRIIEEMDGRGFVKENQELKNWLTTVLHDHLGDPNSTSTLESPAKVHLPTHCPQCGGMLDPGTVNWLDELTAECLYCGSPVRSEG